MYVFINISVTTSTGWLIITQYEVHIVNIVSGLTLVWIQYLYIHSMRFI